MGTTRNGSDRGVSRPGEQAEKPTAIPPRGWWQVVRRAVKEASADNVPMLAAADVSVAYRAKPRVRAAATHAIDHCGLDAVLNLFA